MKTNVLIRFYGDNIPGGVEAILGPCQCGPDVAEVKKFSYANGTKTTVKVWLTLDERDERVAKVLALLAPYGEGEIAYRTDEYTEEELQNALLLYANTWGKDQAGAGKHYGTTYDVSNACKQCGTGVRQTSPLVINGQDERRIEKMHVAGTYHGDFLVNDVNSEKLAKANLTGFNLWRVYSSRKAGPNVELRREQLFAENVMPPMAPSSLLDRKEVCPVCQRGRFNFVFREPPRIVYRAEDLKNIQDVNLSWEWFGSFAQTPEEALGGNWPHPLLLVTPKVMNLLRGKTKKEKKYEGVSFTPVWIEDETGTHL